MSDVSRIFAAEDWRKIYQQLNQVDLSSYDFDNLRRVLLDYVKTNFPEDFNDFIDSSEFVAFIDMMAYMGQSIAFRVDLNSRENFLDTATRRDSIIRLSRMIGYNPRRNIPASGLLKIQSVVTTQSLFDSNGVSLRNKPIIWNDSTNPNFLEQFNLVLSQSMNSNQKAGRPLRKVTIDGVVTELYEVNSLQTSAVVPFTTSVSGVNMEFELVGANIDSSGEMFERNPTPNTGMTILYRNDGRGNASPNTGWFVMFKQGRLRSTDFGLVDALPNQVINIDVSGINDEDVWLYEINNQGNFSDIWQRIAEIAGNNVIYNSVSLNQRKVYSAVSKENDKIDLVFADGQFGDVPKGNFRLYFRTSNGLDYTIRPVDMPRISAPMEVITKNNQQATVTFGLSLRSNVSNSSPAESYIDIKSNAPQAYYTQNRMITAEDYNIYPVITSQEVLKAKAVNRTSSGINRYLDIVDPTGRYSSIKLFAEDGAIFRRTSEESFKFSWTTDSDIIRAIQDLMRPYLTDEELGNFYYAYYDTLSVTRTLNKYTQWFPVEAKTNAFSGYFTDTSDNATTRTPRAFGPSASLVPFKSASKGALLKFVAPTGYHFTSNRELESGPLGQGDVTHLWTKVIAINGDGMNGGVGALEDGTGPVVLSDRVPNGSILVEIIPALGRDFGSLESDIYRTIKQYKDFGLGYDNETGFWYLISNTNLNAKAAFSLALKGDTSNTNSDGSWLMAFEYKNGVYRGRVRKLQMIFRSRNDNKFYFDSTSKVKDPLTGKVKTDEIVVLKLNGDYTNDFKPYRDDIIFHIIGNLIEADGYVDPSSVRISFADRDDDGVPDDLDTFADIVNLDSIVQPTSWQFGPTVPTSASNGDYVLFFEKYLDGSGMYRWREYDAGNIWFANDSTTINLSDMSENQLVYNRTTGELKMKINETLAVNPDYKAYVGRDNLRFKYNHIAADTRRIDPALSNLIDVYVLTRSYNNELRNWLKTDRRDSFRPQPPTSQELRDLLSRIERVKGMSDDIIYHPVKFKLLFGTKAIPTLRAKFKVVKKAGSFVSDNEVRTRVVTATDLFFANANYDFGDTFFWTELSAFIHLQLNNLVSSVVIVPESLESDFGDLFQISSSPDEILLHDLTVDDVEVVDSINQATLS